MATFKSISTTLRQILSSTQNPKLCSSFSKSFFSTGPDYTSDLEPHTDSEQPATESPLNDQTQSGSTPQGVNGMPDYVLEGGLDGGVYKAVILGQVGQNPVQKRLKNGRSVTLTTVGTGGIRNERIPFPTEEPREYANRCNVQWHRVSVYPERLGEIIMKHATPGSLIYLEGNLETKIFTDPITGLIRRIREVAIRRNGRIVFVGEGSGGEFNQPSPNELKGVGYF